VQYWSLDHPTLLAYWRRPETLR